MSHSWTHPWCKSPCRDEAVRASEDNRPGPLPTLEEAIAGVTERRPVDAGGGGNVTGSRTERVTLEITHQHLSHASAFDWPYMVANYFHRNGESVRVVEEAHFDDLAQVAMERDAAIRERDAAKSDAEKSAVRIKSQAENVAYFRRDRDETVSERDAAIRERDALKARVAELEADVADCNILFGDRWREAVSAVTGKAAPAASGAAGTEPDAWGVWRDGSVESVAHRRFRNSAEHSAEHLGGTVVPLYAVPQAAKGWLTQEEREVISYFREACQGQHERAIGNDSPRCGEIYGRRDAILRRLLARSSPPEVVLPRGWEVEVAEIRKALAAAGVTVKEVGK
jgi:hypothetical protein